MKRLFIQYNKIKEAEVGRQMKEGDMCRKPGRDHFGDVDTDRRLILKWIFKKYIHGARL
jgi:hypothetical protein